MLVEQQQIRCSCLTLVSMPNTSLFHISTVHVKCKECGKFNMAVEIIKHPGNFRLCLDKDKGSGG